MTDLKDVAFNKNENEEEKEKSIPFNKKRVRLLVMYLFTPLHP